MLRLRRHVFRLRLRRDAGADAASDHARPPAGPAPGRGAAQQDAQLPPAGRQGAGDDPLRRGWRPHRPRQRGALAAAPRRDQHRAAACRHLRTRDRQGHPRRAPRERRSLVHQPDRPVRGRRSGRCRRPHGTQDHGRHVRRLRASRRRLLLGQRPDQGGSRGRVRRALRGEEHRRRPPGHEVPGAGLVRHRRREAGRDPERHVRRRKGARRHHRGRRGQAVRPQPSRHHQGAEPEAAAVPPDGGVRTLRTHGHRRALGGDDQGGRARRGAFFPTGLSQKKVAVIPAGGAGTRLWPRSRQSKPKHALPLADHGRPLLRDAYDRVRTLVDEVFVVTEQSQRGVIQSVLPEIDREHVILEPSARGTTNAYGLAAVTLAQRDAGAVVISTAADHVVRGRAEVTRAIRAALKAAAETDSIVVLGLKPRFASTGLGYIRARRPGPAGTRRVEQFIEKPNLPTATRFVRTGGYYWNLAWFAWRPSVLVAELARFLPKRVAELRAVVDAQRAGGDATAATIYHRLTLDVS